MAKDKNEGNKEKGDVDKKKLGSSYDVGIIGAGPAGLSAGIYAARYGLKTLILSENIGGMINWAKEIENYPGFIGSGIELMKKFLEQAKKFGCQIVLRKVLDIVSKENGKEFVLKTGNFEFVCKTIILAVGTEKKKLNILGEENLVGRGVSYCATCDAAFYKEKIVCVVGGNDSAAHTALLLAEFAKKVYVIYRKHELRCQAKLYENVKRCKKIEIINDSVLAEIKGKDKVEEVIYSKENKEYSLKIDGVFIEAGSMPSSYLATKIGVKRDNEGFTIVDKDMRTNISGVFSAGDINSEITRQVLIAAASGAQAAISAYNHINEKK
jgi:thioredoxin reductase (NADPH)